MKGSESASVRWAASSPETGKYTGVWATSTAADLIARVDELRVRGSGYCEVQMLGQEFPVLSIGFQGGLAVVHCWWDAENMSLLAGDQSVASDAVVEVWMDGDDDDPSSFTGRFVSAEDRVPSILKQFLQTGDAEPLGDWFNL